MSKVNRKSIKLFKQVDDFSKEPEFETYYTTPYLTIRDTREAWALSDELNDQESGLTESEKIDKLIDFCVNHAFKGQLSKSDFEERFPSGLKELQEVLGFVAIGEDPNELKKSQEKND